MTMSDRRLREPLYMPLADVHKARGLVNHIKDSWWSFHPEKGLLFYPRSGAYPSISNSFPQCNQNESIARRLSYVSWPGIEIRFVESVLQPIDPRDYI